MTLAQRFLPMWVDPHCTTDLPNFNCYNFMRSVTFAQHFLPIFKGLFALSYRSVSNQFNCICTTTLIHVERIQLKMASNWFGLSSLLCTIIAHFLILKLYVHECMYINKLQSKCNASIHSILTLFQVQPKFCVTCTHIIKA